ncbi:MAG: hypothetical protein IPN97_08060 [Saprospiraceae bacterium]|nr:hypothetical protein [Saprospiraceae bacterium]
MTDKTTENINKINQNMNNSAEMARTFKQWLENQMTMAKAHFGQLNTNGTTTPNPTDMMAQLAELDGSG